MSVLIVGTYRDVELDDARPLAQALEELHRQRLASRVALKRLPEDGVEAMLRALSGQEPPAALAKAVYSETEGNPFFVEEVFKHLMEEGKLFDAEGRWRSGLSIGELDVPESVRLVVGQRLQRLSEECRQALTAAAIIGRVFSFELLEALGEVDADALLDAIDEADRAQFITSTSDGREARFTFAHELIRQTLVSGLSLPRRQRIHLRVAEAMETAYVRDLEEHAADLAYHLYQAGAAANVEKTIRYLALAGDQALAAAAFEDALHLFENALSLEATEDRKEHADLLYRRGQALRSVGAWEKALADWQQALSTFEGLGHIEAVGRVSCEVVEQLAWAARWQESVEAAGRGLSALGERASADRCRLLALAGSSESSGGDYEAGEPQLARALAMAEELGDQHLLGVVLGTRASFHFWHMQAREAVDAGLRAVKLLRSAGDLWPLAERLQNAQQALLVLGRFDEAAEIGKEGEPLAARLGHLGSLAAIRRGTGTLEFMVTGDIGRFKEFARADLEICRSADMPWISQSYLYVGLAQFWRGRWEEAQESFQEAVRLEPPGMLSGAAWGYLLPTAAYADRRDMAMSMIDEKRGHLPLLGQANPVGAWMMLQGAVEGLAVLGERDEAAKLYPLVLQARDTGFLVRFSLGPLDMWAGIAAAAGGQSERAEEHYQTALRLAHELPVVISQPETRRWYARMLIDRDGPGDRDKARQLLTETVTMYRQIGMPKHIEMAEEMLAEL